MCYPENFSVNLKLHKKVSPKFDSLLGKVFMRIYKSCQLFTMFRNLLCLCVIVSFYTLKQGNQKHYNSKSHLFHINVFYSYQIKTQDSQLNLNFKQQIIFLVKVCSNIACNILTLKNYLLFIWNSNLTGHAIFLFTKSGNPKYSNKL